MVDWFRGEASKDHAESLAQLVDKVAFKEDGSSTYSLLGGPGWHDRAEPGPALSRLAGSHRRGQLRLAGDFDSDIFEVSQSFDGDTM